jgi:hypothetical protein
MLDYVAEQVGASSTAFRLYARREETRSNHIAHLLGYLQKRNASSARSSNAGGAVHWDDSRLAMRKCASSTALA